MESETAHIWKKLKYFVFNVFCLFADDDVKTSYISARSFDISVQLKNYTLGTAIYLLERIY